MVCRDEEWQHRRHYALIEIVAKMGGGKQSYRFVIDLFGLRRGGRYLDHRTHESLYLPEDPDGGQPVAITPGDRAQGGVTADLARVGVQPPPRSRRRKANLSNL